jgi:hypothetical protein
VAIRLPIWSDEATNMDWMPDNPLPEGILNYSGGLAAAAIAGYRAAPTKENLLRAVNALRNADRATANSAAPCLLEDTARVRFRECFDVRRWTSTLVALHMIRNGMDQDLGAEVHDVWWDVGNAATEIPEQSHCADRECRHELGDVDVSGWSFDPSQHTSTYTGGAFRQLGLPRHATFIATAERSCRVRETASLCTRLCERRAFCAGGLDRACREVRASQSG